MLLISNIDKIENISYAFPHKFEIVYILIHIFKLHSWEYAVFLGEIHMLKLEENEALSHQVAFFIIQFTSFHHCRW